MAATSLTVRLAAAFAVVVALTGMVFGAAGYVTTERQVTAQVDNFLRQRAGDIADGQRGRPARPGDGRPGPGPGAVDDDALVQILDGDGNIVTRSGAALPVLAEDVTIAAGRPSEGSRPESLLRTVDTADGELRLITLGLPPAGAVQVGRYLEETNAVVSGLRSRLIWVAIGTGVAAAALGAWMARRIAEPIRSLAASVDTVAATGDFSTPILVNGSDEVGRLAAGFDNLLQSLAASRRQQNQLVQDVAHELR
ncbi:MAG: HAMP domain-containing protein, partial [Acidimicrobiia bacterium]|nr:HAMP domain-containing protein [Acidimicrobiia bacterium]